MPDEASEDPGMPVGVPQQPEPSKFDKALHTLQTEIGQLTWQIAVGREEIKEVVAERDAARAELEAARLHLKELEEVLAPFLAVEPESATAGEAPSSPPANSKQKDKAPAPA